MTPFPAPAPSRVTPTQLLIAAVVSFVVSVACIVGLPAVVGGIAPLALIAGVAGRVLFTASVVCAVLAAIRKFEAR
jgi:hypothetical protein